MIRRWLSGLPSLFVCLLLLSGCQAGTDSPSEPLGRGLEGAARCDDADLNREKRLFPDNERQRQVEALCQDILAERIDADLGADQLHVLAYDGWQAGNLGNATAQDLADFNAAVRGLDPVALLDPDEQPVWDTSNIGDDRFLAVGPTTDDAAHCFGSGLETWCFRVQASEEYFLLAEARADEEDAGVCPGDLPNDCEEDVIHIDVNPDEAIDDGNLNTNIHVWSCTDFASRHARFAFDTGVVDPGEYGSPTGLDAPQEIVDACEESAELSGVQRWLWASLKPVRWAAGVEAVNAAGTGTTFARASLIGEGEQGQTPVRTGACRVSSRFASVADGTICRAFPDSDWQPSEELTRCDTRRVEGEKKVGQCTWPEPFEVPGDNPDDEVCYWAVLDKVINASTTFHTEGEICFTRNSPVRGETKVFSFTLNP